MVKTEHDSMQNGRIDCKTGLLVSARTAEEARQVLAAGGTWLDLKEPLLGSLGRPTRAVAEQFLTIHASEHVERSIAGGELSNWNIEQDHAFAVMLPEDCYLKIGLSNQHTNESFLEKAIAIQSHLKRRNQLILVYYADELNARCPSWLRVLEAARSFNCRYVLIDTFDKTAGGLLSHIPVDQLSTMIRQANTLRLGIALAGSLRLDQLPTLTNLGARWLGVRGAICENHLRTDRLCSDRMRQALSMFQQASSEQSFSKQRLQSSTDRSASRSRHTFGNQA
jgi:(5-formylfuran-3-yl)methyl phosphate synthase